MGPSDFRFISLSRKLIKDETALMPQFLDFDISCRKNIENHIISSIKPISEGRPCENLFVYGPSGAGKTTLVKHVLDHIRESNRRVLTLYVNCWYHSTSMAIYTKIADALGEPFSRRGRAADEVFDRIMEMMDKTKTSVLLALDEVDALVYRRETRVLHNITNISNKNVLFGVIYVSEDKNILSKVQPKVNGGIGFTPIEIAGYNKQELFDMLKKRASAGLFEGSFNDLILEKIAEIGVNNNGNGKLALELLWKTAKLTEAEGKENLSVEDIETISQRMNYNKNHFTVEEQIILGTLKNGERNSSEIYWLFQKQLIRSKRQIRNYLICLEGKGVIETRTVETAGRLPFKLIRLKNGGD